MLSSKLPSRRSILRSKLDKKYQTDSDLSAFILDHFPEVYRKLSNSSDRNSKINSLLEREDILDLLERLLLQPKESNEISHSEINISPHNLSNPVRVHQFNHQSNDGDDSIERHHKYDHNHPKMALFRSSVIISASILLSGIIGASMILINCKSKKQQSSDFCKKCDSCIPELIDEIKECVALREVMLFLDNKPSMQRAAAHSTCTVDSIINQRTNGNVHLCSNEQYRAKLFFLIDILSNSDLTSEIGHNLPHYDHYEHDCSIKKDWQACIKAGELQKTAPRRCDFLWKACDYGLPLHTERCLAYFYPEFECPLNGQIPYNKREEILIDLCENAGSSLACFSLGQILENRNVCKASNYYAAGCMFAKQLPEICRILFKKNQTEFIGKDCEPSGRRSCESIHRLYQQGILSTCPDARDLERKATSKMKAIGEPLTEAN